MANTKTITGDGLAIFLRSYGPGTDAAPRSIVASTKTNVQSTGGAFADSSIFSGVGCLVRLVGYAVTAGKVSVKDGGAGGTVKATLYLSGAFNYELNIHIATSLYLDFDGTVANGDITALYLDEN